MLPVPSLPTDLVLERWALFSTKKSSEKGRSRDADDDHATWYFKEDNHNIRDPYGIRQSAVAATVLVTCLAKATLSV